MQDDVTLNKAAIVKRCLDRVHEEYGDDPTRLRDLTVQDSVVLNLQRACEACIDLAMHVVAVRKLGIPQDARNAFDLLFGDGLVDEALLKRMKAMVGFRNIAVHEYQSLDLQVVEKILQLHVGDFGSFIDRVLRS